MLSALSLFSPRIVQVVDCGITDAVGIRRVQLPSGRVVLWICVFLAPDFCSRFYPELSCSDNSPGLCVPPRAIHFCTGV